MSSSWWTDKDDLDEFQSKIIDLPQKKSYLVTGPPGSGKTNLLLLRANYLYLTGHKNLQIVVFTRALQDFMASGGSQYDFPQEKLRTSSKFWRDILFQYGITVALPAGFEECRKALVNAVQKLVDDHSLSHIYDTILLDESQDYLPEEIELFKRLGKHVFATADARQKIYTGADPLATLRASVDKELTLQFHYRIGRKICKVADALMKDTDTYTAMEPDSQYDEVAFPSSVSVVKCDSLAEQVDRLVETIKTQIKTYPGELLGVLCPRSEDFDKLCALLKATELNNVCTFQGDSDHLSFDSKTRVCLSTIHTGKGLEFRAVHLVAAEGLKKFRNQRKMAFTGVTRAKTTLTVYHVDSLPGYLEQALSDVEGAIESPSMNQVFGKKKS